jgi:hypothetical protein
MCKRKRWEEWLRVKRNEWKMEKIKGDHKERINKGQWKETEVN